jgi:hypothetical protein
LRNINLNQFALPGMEEQSHPGARHLAAGAWFEHGTDWSHGWGGQGRKEAYEHRLTAYDQAQGRPTPRILGQLKWAGEAQYRPPGSRHNHFPGEIIGVTRYEGGAGAVTPHKGIMTAMLRMAQGEQMSASTIPTHSPERTAYGEKWATKAGPPELTPERNDWDWRPPEGIHPYERAGSPPQLAGHVKGQRELFKGDRYDRDPF